MAALAIDLSADDRLAYAACMDGVYQLNCESGAALQLYKHRSYASGIVCFSEQETLVSGGYDGQLIWFDLKDMEFSCIKSHAQLFSPYP